MVTRLLPGQTATVLQLPASTVTHEYGGNADADTGVAAAPIAEAVA
jgi:hypothetical protein